MNKKYISLAIVTILTIVVGVYKHMEGLTQVTPNVDGSTVLGIKDDLKISNEIASFTEEGNDFIKITYKYTISHVGNYTAKNVIAHNWFTDTPENTFEVLSITSDSQLKLNSSFNGKGDTNIISGNNEMSPMSSAVVFVTVRLAYRERALQFISYVDVSGKSGDEGATGSSGGVGTTTSSKTSTSTNPSTPKPSATTTTQPSTASSKTSTSTAPVVIDYNFKGLQATAADKYSTSMTIGYNHGVRLAWSNTGPDCVRVTVPPNTQWQGNSEGNQGYKDIMNLKVDTVFSLNCKGTVYSVNVKVNPPKTTSSSGTTTPTVTVSSSASSDPINIPNTQTSSTGNVGGAEVLGLYDAAQVTFSLPRQGSVAGAATMQTGGKGQ